MVRYGPAFTGDLQHWDFDTFRVTWRDPQEGPSFVTYTLDAAGKVDRMEVEGITTFRPVAIMADSAAAH